MSENWLKENKADLEKIGIKEYQKGNLVLFNSYHTDGSQVISNFDFNCEIWINGRCYRSVEQLYNCIVFGNSKSICDKVMSCNSGSEVKRAVKGYERELNILDDMRILRFAIRCKYLYNKKFRQFFDKNLDKVYVEDEYWSDLNLWGAKWDSEKNVYKGYNISGRLYNELRKGINKDDLWIDDNWLICGEKIAKDSIGVGYNREKKNMNLSEDDLMKEVMDGII